MAVTPNNYNNCNLQIDLYFVYDSGDAAFLFSMLLFVNFMRVTSSSLSLSLFFVVVLFFVLSCLFLTEICSKTGRVFLVGGAGAIC